MTEILAVGITTFAVVWVCIAAVPAYLGLEYRSASLLKVALTPLAGDFGPLPRRLRFEAAALCIGLAAPIAISINQMPGWGDGIDDAANVFLVLAFVFQVVFASNLARGRRHS